METVQQVVGKVLRYKFKKQIKPIHLFFKLIYVVSQFFLLQHLCFIRSLDKTHNLIIALDCLCSPNSILFYAMILILTSLIDYFVDV